MRTPAQALTAWADDEITFVIGGSVVPHTRQQFKTLMNLIVLCFKERGGGDSYDQYVYSGTWEIVNQISKLGSVRTGCAGREDVEGVLLQITELPNAAKYENFDDVKAAASKVLGVDL